MTDMAESIILSPLLTPHTQLPLLPYSDHPHSHLNQLSLNVPKCMFMLVGTLAKVHGIRIHINNEPLKQVTVSKYLGMKIYSNLKWDDHISAIIPQI